MLVLAILFLVGPVTAFLSLTLKDSINRWVNVIVGVVFVGFTILTIGEYLTIQSAYSASKIMIEVVGLVFWHLLSGMHGSLNRKHEIIKVQMSAPKIS